MKIPWAHQESARRFIRERFLRGKPGSLIAGDMGIGKTFIGAEAMAEHLQADPRAEILIICPMTVVTNWDKESYEVLGAGVTRIAHAGGPTTRALRALELRRKMLGPLVVIVNYEAMLGKLGAEIWKHRWSLILCDEAQRLKAAGGKISKRVSALAARCDARRISLTGTPTPHSHLDAYGIMRFTDPNVFGTNFDNFKHRYTRRKFYGEDTQPIRVKERGQGGRMFDLVPIHMDEFEAKLALASWRVTARDVLDLPPSVTEERTVTVREREAIDAYWGMHRKLVADVGTGKLLASNLGVRVTRLQQIVNGMVKDEGGNPVTLGKAKLNALGELFDEIPLEEPIVVFGRFHTDLDQIRTAARKSGRTSQELSGRVHTPTELELWQRGQTSVLAVQIQSGGVGIDLTRARYAVWFTMPWSVAEYTQAKARLVRPGQERPVTFVRLLCEINGVPSIDQMTAHAMDSRREALDEIMQALEQGDNRPARKRRAPTLG